MGVDTAQIFNHNIQYQNSAQLLQQLQLHLGKPVTNLIYNSACECLTKLPEDYNGYIISTENNTTIENAIEALELLDFTYKSPEDDSGYFYINPFLIENSLSQIQIPRWQFTAEMCRVIRDFGLHNFDYYEAEDVTRMVDYSNGCYLLESRKSMQTHIAKFGSTKMISFCCDYHDVYLEHIANNCSFDDFVSWGKKEFIYVEFKDLHSFDFPEKKPDYYNVFIYDDFSDLKK